MNILTICPCCSNAMVHHISNNRDYWFCRSCWQEMPDLGEVKNRCIRRDRILNLSIGLKNLAKPALV